VIDYDATEGRSWRLWLSGDGARITRLPPRATTADEKGPDVVARGTASDLVLVFYGRIPLESLTIDGDRRLLDLLVDWDPDA
jgi:hypothetical protein